MAKPIQVDDLKVGMRVTVLEWHPEERVAYESFALTATITKSRDHSYVGEVLTVKAVDPPFIVVQHMKRDWPIDLDTRRLRLAVLSDEYIAAMAGKEQQRTRQ